MSEASLEAAREALRLWASKYSNDVCVVSLTFRSDPVLKVLERTIADAIDTAREQGSAAERAKTVAWLRSMQTWEGKKAPLMDFLADAIERGEHDKAGDEK